MAIVKMKRLHILALESDRNILFDHLQRLGCVEVSEQTDKLSDPDWTALVHPDESDLTQQQARLEQVVDALNTLDQYAPVKTKLLAPLPQIKAAALFDEENLNSTLRTAGEIVAYNRDLSGIYDQIQKEKSFLGSLVPWLSLDVPLNTQPSEFLYTAFGTIPSAVDLDIVRKDLCLHADTSELYEASADTEMHYLFFLCHAAQQENALEVLRSYGFSNASFKGTAGTARETYELHTKELEILEQKRASLLETLASYKESRSAIQLAYDRLSLETQKEQCKLRLLATDKTFLLDGWVPVTELSKLTDLLDSYDCAYTLSDPTPEEYPNVPIQLRNNKFTRCFNMVTEMYSLPAYNNLDPNPLMAPFFLLFYGLMLADMGYGILMVVIGQVILSKKHPSGGMRNFAELIRYCGFSTFFWGALTGGFFGDFLLQFIQMVNPDTTFAGLPSLFTPLNDTLIILVGSLILGCIQLLTGMIIKFVKSTQDGRFWDAMMDQGSWWLLFAGIGIGAATGFWWIAIAGVLALVCTQGRDRPTIPGKIIGGISSLYDITSYFSDILSYSRLMALMLAGSVIAQVFNTLAAITGNVVTFILIFLVGHALNFGLNLLGCYVHDLRLQCLEYFGKFYEDGGIPFQPLQLHSKYYDISKDTM